MINVENLISFLFAEDELNFPGFGVLYKKIKPSKISLAKNKIEAPEYQFTFVYNDFNKEKYDLLVNYISKINNQSKEDSIKSIQKLSIDLLSNIANYNEAQIEGLGTFYKDKENINFNLAPVLNEIIQHSNKDIPLVLVKKENSLEENDNIQTENESSLTDNTIFNTTNIESDTRKNYIPTIIWSVFGLAFLLFLLCFNGLICNKPMDTDLSIENDTIVDTQENNDEAIFEIDSSDIFEPNKDTVSNKSSETNTEDQIFLEELSDNSEQIIISGTSLADYEQYAEVLKSKYNNTGIIICGSFNKSKYAEKLLGKIIKYGYEPFVEKYNNFTRVGLVFDLNNNNLTDLLTKVQYEIDKNSWILQPDQNN